MADFNYTGITPADVVSYRDKLNTLLGTDKIGGGIWTPPKSPLLYPSVAPIQPVSTTPVAPVKPVTPPIEGGSYVIKAGDTLSGIAATLGTTAQELARLNNIADPNRIIAGSTIKITPAKAIPLNPEISTTPIKTTPTGGTGIDYTKMPQGWDRATYTNFKNANPTLEPTSEDTAKMLRSGHDEAIRKQAEIAGRAGVTLDEWTKMNAPTEAESQKIADELGITKLEGELFKKPSQTSQQVYENAYNTSGLADVKTQIAQLNNEITQERNTLRAAIGKIDENPFLTETSRVGRGKRVMAQSEAVITNKLDQMNRLQNLYDKGIGEINSVITRNASDFGVSQQIDQAHLNYLQKKAETMTTRATAEKVQTGISTFLGAKAKSAKPDTIGSTETGYFRWDPMLQKFTQVIKGVPKATTPTSFAPTAAQKALVGRYLSTDEAKAAGATSDDLVKAGTDPTFFFYLLQKANEAGIY